MSGKGHRPRRSPRPSNQVSFERFWRDINDLNLGDYLDFGMAKIWDDHLAATGTALSEILVSDDLREKLRKGPPKK